MRAFPVELPKEFCFILGEYLPPPLGILTLASYLETEEEERAHNWSWKLSFKVVSVVPSSLRFCASLLKCNAHGATDGVVY